LGIGPITVLGFEDTLGYINGSYLESHLRRDSALERCTYHIPLNFIEFRVGLKNTLINGFDIQEVRKYAMALELSK